MKNLLGISAAVLGLLALTGTSQAQTILWGVAQNMTGNPDISTAGTYFDAVTAGSAQIVNNGVAGSGGINVPFNALTGNPATDGTISLTIGDDQGNFTAPFTTSSPSSASYSNLVNTGVFGAGGSSLVTIGGLGGLNLTTGDTYQVQSWSWYSGDGTATTIYDGANTVSLTNAVGQYAIGTFTATGPQETYDFSTSTGHQFVNVISVRDITVAVPEPSSMTLMVLGLAGMTLFIRRKYAKA